MQLDPPFEYYVGAGSVTNTIWNEISGYPLEYGISDIDIVYYDKYNLDVHHETKLKKELERILGDFSFKLDVKNQARVHFWYESKFGFPIKPYMSIETAIDSWPTTATAIGVRLEHNGLYTIYSPYGFNDLFSMVVRPNKLLVAQEIYESKSTKWKEKWPLLEIIPW
ncbi:nucleotidyltransferase family protein [Psychrobacillus sp. BL-248-WT-3]|uniref:nucleotidyltransferase family protein n=1 Tax=Psychrobacillus sp. BL-248-WT-3 TaxID=2725306 RepID=UPI00146E807B|nr:nucleotidyltransferase family protein [Psychrobacillus sp. BL-248-WT-3]NME07076.1 nucleotidyltransferase family protein [Psychrobacillus sp. BL-248-WT-3]